MGEKDFELKTREINHLDIGKTVNVPNVSRLYLAPRMSEELSREGQEGLAADSEVVKACDQANSIISVLAEKSTNNHETANTQLLDDGRTM